MDEERRQFLKTVVKGGLLITVFPLVPAQAAASKASQNMFAYIVDTQKCIGCGKCVVACSKENKVPDHSYRTWIERYTIFEEGEVIVDSPDGGSQGFKNQERQKKIEKSFFVPKLCNHCRNPNCVQVCPVGATYVTKEGFVLVDQEHCVGCSYCFQACPYGARFMNHYTHTVDKCTWCYHRVTKGLMPACVLICPTGARTFGRIDDPASSVYKTYREARLQILKPETGNEPMTFYVGLDKEVR